MRHRWSRRPLYREVRKITVTSAPEARRLSKHRVVAAYISGIAVVGAVVFSVYQHYQTRKLLEPTERPILQVIYSEKTTENFYEKEAKAYIEVEITIKNQGKHPASTIRISHGEAPIDTPRDFKRIKGQESLANSIGSDAHITYVLIYEMEKTSKKEYHERKQLIYLGIIYEDEYKPGNDFLYELWARYKLGNEHLDWMSNTEKRMLEPYVYKTFPFIKDLKNHLSQVNK